MRAVLLFSAGVLVGLTVQAGVTAQGNRVMAVNHVGITVENVDEAVKSIKTRWAFARRLRSATTKGRPVLTYLQVSRETFIELQPPASADRRPGISHIGLEVPDITAALARLKGLGVATEEARKGRTNSVLSNITAPGNARFELVELPPDSLPRKAMAAWK